MDMNKIDAFTRSLLRLSLAVSVPIAVFLGARSLASADVPFPPVPKESISAQKMKGNFDYLEAKIDALSASLSQHDGRLNDLDGKTNGLSSSQAQQDSRLDALEARPVGATVQWPVNMLPGDSGVQECVNGFSGTQANGIYSCFAACYQRCVNDGYKAGFHTGTGDWPGKVVTCACLK